MSASLLKKLLLLLTIFLSTEAYAQEYFTTTYGGTYLEQLTKTRKTADGGYVLVGSTDSYGPNAGSLGSNYYVVKTDATGQQQWAKAAGGMNNDFPYDVRQTQDGGFLVFGYSASFGSIIRAMLVRLDPNGQVLWTKTYSASTNVNGYCVFEKGNGNIILAGSIEDMNGMAQNWIAETDAQGNLIHSYNYWVAADDRITSIDTTRDGSILMCGYTSTITSYDIVVFKLDTALNATWYIRENNSLMHEDRAHCIRELPDGTILIGGGCSAHEMSYNGSDMILYKFDSAGNALGGNLYGQSDIYETVFDMWVDPLSKRIYANGEAHDALTQLGLTVVADSALTMVDIVNPGFGKLAYYQRCLSISRNADRSFVVSGQTSETGGGGDFFLALRDSNLAATQSCPKLPLH